MQTPGHYQLWLNLFAETLQQRALGVHAERAMAPARRVVGNMRQNLSLFSGVT
ncbi:MAG: hypothetical protein NWP69_02580 [Congregibacter sp.]|nr:hypothetical protein [Congregibacter sp.]